MSAFAKTLPSGAVPDVESRASAPSVRRLWWLGFAAAVAWAGAASITQFWADIDDLDGTDLLATVQFVIAALLLAAALFHAATGRLYPEVRRLGAWAVALAVLLAVWEIVTAKLLLLPRPFFAAPQSMLQVYVDDWPRLGTSVVASLILLLPGYLIGVAAGFVTGVAVGWSRLVGYWLHPVLRLIGPLPATAWIPVAFFALPTARSASTFLIALATGFPVAVLTWSGVAAVSSAYYDIARTMGASNWFLIRRVAIPAALPSVFVGMFMGLGASFSVLVVAEMLGVKAGLGWYLQWAQGWAAYGNMYAALLVMALMCAALIGLLFLLRDRLLSWQKGLLRW
jgi:NitT/TauT family transport system permease protein